MVVIHRDHCSWKWGLFLGRDDQSPDLLRIVGIEPGGLFATENLARVRRMEPFVVVGDHITAINGHRDHTVMLDHLARSMVVMLTIRKSVAAREPIMAPSLIDPLHTLVFSYNQSYPYLISCHNLLHRLIFVSTVWCSAKS